MEFKDYYKIMGIGRDATQDEIKRTYRKLARKYHPDVSTDANAEARFKEVGEAYEVLKDPEKRAAFDRLLDGGYHAGENFSVPPGWDAGFEFSGSGFSQRGAGQFSDFFESLFGSAGFGADFGAAGRRQGFRTGPESGSDQHASILIDLEDACLGADKTFQLQVPEYDRNGSMTYHTRTLKVKIPSGVTDGQRIRLAGQGEAMAPGGKRGDLYLQIDIRPHRHFKVDGRDVLFELPVTPWEAALGARLQVPTPGGSVEMQIPAGVQSGSRLRLKGRGLGKSPPGDQIVQVMIKTPPADTPARRELYEKMAQEMRWDPRVGTH